jgi:hypothetical protein
MALDGVDVGHLKTYSAPKLTIQIPGNICTKGYKSFGLTKTSWKPTLEPNWIIFCLMLGIFFFEIEMSHRGAV